MPIPNGVLDPSITDLTHYLADQPYDKRSLKTIRGRLDGMCPRGGRLDGCWNTPAFKKNRDYFELAMRRALRDNGRSPPVTDRDLYLCVRNALEILGQLVRSKGRETQSERQRLRGSARWIRDFLRNLRQSDQRSAAAD